MKTTIDIPDALLVRARRHARKKGTSLRALVEEGLRRVLETEPSRSGYKLVDRSVGRPDGPNPLEGLSWSDLRAKMYGGH